MLQFSDGTDSYENIPFIVSTSKMIISFGNNWLLLLTFCTQ